MNRLRRLATLEAREVCRLGQRPRNDGELAAQIAQQYEHAGRIGHSDVTGRLDKVFDAVFARRPPVSDR